MIDVGQVGLGAAPALPQFGEGVQNLANQAQTRADAYENTNRQIPGAAANMLQAASGAAEGISQGINGALAIRQGYADKDQFNSLLEEAKGRGIDPLVVAAVQKQAGDGTNGELNRKLFQTYIMPAITEMNKPKADPTVGDNVKWSDFKDDIELKSLPVMRSVFTGMGNLAEGLEPKAKRLQNNGEDADLGYWDSLSTARRQKLGSDVLKIKKPDGSYAVKVRIGSDAGAQFKSRLLASLNPYIKMIAGSAVSAQEMTRIAVAMGMPESVAKEIAEGGNAKADDFTKKLLSFAESRAIFVDPQAVRGAMARGMIAYRNSIDQTYGAMAKTSVPGSAQMHTMGSVALDFVNQYMPKEFMDELQAAAGDAGQLEYQAPVGAQEYLKADANLGRLSHQAEVAGRFKGLTSASQQITKTAALDNSGSYKGDAANLLRNEAKARTEGARGVYGEYGAALGKLSAEPVSKWTDEDFQKAVRNAKAGNDEQLFMTLIAARAAGKTLDEAFGIFSDKKKSPAPLSADLPNFSTMTSED